MPRAYKPPATPQPNANVADQLKRAGTQPIQVAPGGPQGQRQQLEADQAAVPLPDSQEQMQQAMMAAKNFTPPQPLDRPTDYPGEPITAGLPIGAGAGSDQLAAPYMQPAQSDFQKFAPWLPMLELLASKPGTTVGTRNFIRQIRAAQAASQQYPVRPS